MPWEVSASSWHGMAHLGEPLGRRVQGGGGRRQGERGHGGLLDPCQATPSTAHDATRSEPQHPAPAPPLGVTQGPGEHAVPLSPEAPPPQGTLESQPRGCPSQMRALEESGTQDLAFSGNIPPQHWILSFSALDPPVWSKHIPTCSKNRISETKIPACFYTSLFQMASTTPGAPRRPSRSDRDSLVGCVRAMRGCSPRGAPRGGWAIPP